MDPSNRGSAWPEVDAVTYAASLAVCSFMRTHKVLIAVVAVLATATSCSSNDDKTEVDAAPKMQVVLDYSPTLSDAGALLYLASHPAVELLAVTLPGTGEADCEPGLRITRSLLVMTGWDDVPIGCGRNTPLIADRDWPDEWRTEVNGWGNEMAPVAEEDPLVDAEQLLADTLRAATEPVTLVAVGPLTNLGVVLADEPELAEQVARIVIMGGAVTVPGNVEESPAAEWNIYVDPEAARRVIAAGIAVTFVPLDATNYVAWTDRLVARLGALDSAAAQEVHRLATSRGSLDGFYLWDELAAMVAVEPTLVITERMTVRIDDDGAVVRDEGGVAVDVAISADTSTAMDAFVKGLNGGTAPPEVSLTADELDYFVLMGGADSQFNTAIGRAFNGVDENDLDLNGEAADLLAGFIAAIDGLLVSLVDVSPPSALRSTHTDYVDSLSEFVERRDDILAAVGDAEGANINEILGSTMEILGIDNIFERINSTCQALVDYSFLRGGPRPCSRGG